jgi:hypothetical protein
MKNNSTSKTSANNEQNQPKKAQGPVKLKPEEMEYIRKAHSRLTRLKSELGDIIFNAEQAKNSKMFEIAEASKGMEAIIADMIVHKYGQGNIDVDNGIFIPSPVQVNVASE